MDDDRRYDVPRGPAVVGWIVVVLLAMLAIASALFRGVAVTDPDSAAVRLQRSFFRALNGDETLIDQYESRFAARPLMTLLHVVPGALFLALAPLQFSTRIRTRYLRFHRWSGRLLVVAAIVSAVTGLFFGVVIPIAGFGETSSVALFGALTLIAVMRGYFLIRQGDVVRHREWMIRAFAICLGVGTIRIIGGIMQLFVRTTPERTIVISFWMGWAVTLAAAELWIRLTSRSARRYSSAGRGIGSAFQEPPALLHRGEGSPP